MSDAEFLDRLYSCPAGQTEEAIYFVISGIDEMMLAGAFGDVDRIVQKADCTRLPTDILVSLLTASAWARSRLPSRPAFADRAHAVIVERHPDRAAAILRGLE